MGEGNAAAGARPSSTCRGRRGGGCGLALGRLVRKLRRQSRMLCAATTGAGAGRPAAAASRYCQYDPLSYARNFDRNGFGSTAFDDDDVSGHLYHYTFASRFVLATSSSAAARQPLD